LSLEIGDEVTVTVPGIRGSDVPIGVAAPRAIPVRRGEVYARIQADRVSGIAANEPRATDSAPVLTLMPGGTQVIPTN
jgi:carbon storage regulator